MPYGWSRHGSPAGGDFAPLLSGDSTFGGPAEPGPNFSDSWLATFEAFCDPTLVTASLFVETLHFDRQLLLDIPRARRTTLLQPHDSAALDASETFLRGEIADQHFWIRVLYRCSRPLLPRSDPDGRFGIICKLCFCLGHLSGIGLGCSEPTFAQGARYY